MIGRLSIDFLTKKADELFSQGDIEKILSDFESDGLSVVDDKGRPIVAGLLNNMSELAYELLYKKYKLPSYYFYPIAVLSHYAWQLDLEMRDNLSSFNIKKRLREAFKSIKKQFKKSEYKRIASEEFFGITFLLCLKIKHSVYGEHLVSINKMELKGDDSGTGIQVEYSLNKDSPIEYSR